MLKASMTLGVALLLLGISVETGPASRTVKFVVSPTAQAHVLNWEHYHQCNPSPCKRLRDRHKMGTGSVTE